MLFLQVVKDRSRTVRGWMDRGMVEEEAMRARHFYKEHTGGADPLKTNYETSRNKA